MICRVWRGWTDPANADAYERLLRGEVLAGIEKRAIEGFRGMQVARRETEGEVEFLTTMWLDSLAAVREFAGDDYERAVVPPAARALLTRFDERSSHYEVVEPGPLRAVRGPAGGPRA